MIYTMMMLRDSCYYLEFNCGSSLVSRLQDKNPLIWFDYAVEAEEEVVAMVQVFGKSWG